MPHTYRIDPPWASAIAQGEAASLLVRLHAETGDDFFAEGAARALRPMQVPTARGGLLAELEGGLTFFEEYPTRPASLVLNGGIFALWGFGDVATGLGDASAEEWWRRGVESLLALLDRYDTGYWSRYDLYPHPIANVASGAYQLLHENQLGVLARQTGEVAFARASDRFAAYRASRRGRRRAFLSKAAFRMLVPRNPLLANRTPFTRRAGRRGHEDLVVLCYHGISEEWSSELTVTPAQLEAHVGRMLAKGYSAATFSEAILAPRWRKTFAVTFDDAYASVGRLARPVLDRLGVPATVFVPTAFQDSREPMSWPGIDHWAGGGHRSELRPLGWEQLRELQAGGMGDRIAHADPPPPDPACGRAAGGRAAVVAPGLRGQARRRLSGDRISLRRLRRAGRAGRHTRRLRRRRLPATGSRRRDGPRLAARRHLWTGRRPALPRKGLARDAVGPPLALPRDHRVRLRPAPGAPLELNGRLSNGETPRRPD